GPWTSGAAAAAGPGRAGPRPAPAVRCRCPGTAATTTAVRCVPGCTWRDSSPPAAPPRSACRSCDDVTAALDWPLRTLHVVAARGGIVRRRPMSTLTPGRIAPANAAALPPYSPTPYVDFSKPGAPPPYEKAPAAPRAEVGQEYPIVIGGQPLKGGRTFDSTNPARPAEVLGRFQSATREQAAQAVEAAFATFKTWSRVPAAV